MKLHEYQARELLANHGIPVPQWILVDTPDEAAKSYEQLESDHGAQMCVVKAQVHAGGRGKGGGVKLVKSADEAHRAAATILDKPLVTPQTGPQGVKVHKIIVADAVDIDKEYYLGVAVDRSRGCPLLIASREGGMEIEQVSASRPGEIIREPIHPTLGIQPFQGKKIGYQLGFDGKQIEIVSKIIQQLAALFMEIDASLVEINPLVRTPPTADNPQGDIWAVDAKIDIDDNALFRHADLQRLADPLEEDPAEARARNHGLSYIKLEGSIGCLVNGAGLAMATMDLVKMHGGEPANFLDVGGSASEEAVMEAFRIILEDGNVKGVLVNIFGGIAKCDTIARAIITAATEVGFTVPLVVRLEGTNVIEARQILHQAKPQLSTLQTATDLTDAATQIMAAIDS